MSIVDYLRMSGSIRNRVIRIDKTLNQIQLFLIPHTFVSCRIGMHMISVHNSFLTIYYNESGSHSSTVAGSKERTGQIFLTPILIFLFYQTVLTGSNHSHNKVQNLEIIHIIF